MSKTTSYVGIELIMSFEGCRLNAYKADPSEVYLTIGYGHYGADVTPGMMISQGDAKKYLKEDVKKFEKKVNKYDSVYAWTQNEFDALVSFAYNIGSIDQLTSNGTRTKAQIAEKIKEYNKCGGRVLAGLTRRREAECKLFCKDGCAALPNTLPVLKKGSKGDYVRSLQHILNEHKFRNGTLIEDGIFGNNTYLAVIEAQGYYNLAKDGIVGTKTWSMLMTC